MPWSNSQFDGTLTIPTGATSGARVVIDGDTGRIEVYDSADALVYVIDGMTPGATAGPPGQPQIIVGSTSSAGYVRLPTNRPIEEDVATILAGVLNSGAPNEGASLQIIGPSVSGADDSLSLFLSSQNNDGTSQANLIVRYDDGAGGTANLLTLDNAAGLRSNRAVAVSPASASGNAVTVNAPAGMTGDLLVLAVNSGVRLQVNESGVIETYGDNAFETYVPAWGNIGTATLSNNVGWYQRVGKMVFFTAYATFNAAGSGASAVTVTAPVSLYRGTRQALTLNYSNVFGAGNVGNGSAVVFVGGAGAVIDALRASDQGATNSDTSITGADITASSIITVSGWVREA